MSSFATLSAKVQRLLFGITDGFSALTAKLVIGRRHVKAIFLDLGVIAANFAINFVVHHEIRPLGPRGPVVRQRRVELQTAWISVSLGHPTVLPHNVYFCDILVKCAPL